MGGSLEWHQLQVYSSLLTSDLVLRDVKDIMVMFCIVVLGWVVTYDNVLYTIELYQLKTLSSSRSEERWRRRCDDAIPSAAG
jgi:hypothetical protein